MTGSCVPYSSEDLPREVHTFETITYTKTYLKMNVIDNMHMENVEKYAKFHVKQKPQRLFFSNGRF